MLSEFSIFLPIPGQKTSRRGRVSSHENCVVAVFEFERITGVAELNEGCRRARLLRDRCCHGDTNPVLRQFTISTRALHRSLRPRGKARSISANAKSRFNGHFVSGQERILAPSPNSFARVPPFHGSDSFFFLGTKICPIFASSEWKIGSKTDAHLGLKIKIPIYAIDTRAL